MSSSARSDDATRASVPLFSLRDVGLERAGRRVLDALTLDLPQAGITGIIGPSGAGKTSLLRLLNRLDDPTRGEVRFLDRPLGEHPVRALRRRVAFVFQAPALFAGTVSDNLQIAAELGGPTAAPPAPDAAQVLSDVGLGAEYAHRAAVQLSVGEQQRVSVARALMTRPEVLLLDEPTSALDPESSSRLLANVARLSDDQRIRVIMVTHRLSEARQFTTHSLMLEAGRLVEWGTTQQLFAAATTERARAYLATSSDARR